MLTSTAVTEEAMRISQYSKSSFADIVANQFVIKLLVIKLLVTHSVRRPIRGHKKKVTGFLHFDDGLSLRWHWTCVPCAHRPQSWWVRVASVNKQVVQRCLHFRCRCCLSKMPMRLRIINSQMFPQHPKSTCTYLGTHAQHHPSCTPHFRTTN